MLPGAKIQFNFDSPFILETLLSARCESMELLRQGTGEMIQYRNT